MSESADEAGRGDAGRGDAGPSGGHLRRRWHRPAAPTLLDPILVAWERLDRRRRHIRPARPGGVLGLELRRYRGRDVALPGGAVVHRGDLIGEIHIDNARFSEVVARERKFGIQQGRADLAAMARWAARRSGPERPVAIHADSLLAPLAARAGFFVRPRRRTPRARLDDWFLRWLMAHWSADGRTRLQHGRSALRSSECWMPIEVLIERYDPPAGPGGS